MPFDPLYWRMYRISFFFRSGTKVKLFVLGLISQEVGQRMPLDILPMTSPSL